MGCFVHDPNQNTELSEKPVIESLKSIKKQNVIRIGDIQDNQKGQDIIIPNHANDLLRNGHCDIISSMVAATMIIGDDFVKVVQDKCKEVGASCVEELGKELNPLVDKILIERMQALRPLETMKPNSSGKLQSKGKGTEL